MPVYDYVCRECGVFQKSAPISQFDAPCACPSCGAVSPRALTVPQLSKVSSFARRAHDINQRSSDSPMRAKANGLQPTGPRIKSKARYHADGSRSLGGHRPWMLSH
ncbi:MAG: zinc ribbon domain-containing protein [Pseudomonadota bacterium]